MCKSDSQPPINIERIRMLKLQPAQVPGGKQLKNVCPKCGRTISQGSYFIVLTDNGIPQGIIPEGEQECCKETADGPKLYSTLSEAELGVNMLASNTLNFDLLPLNSVAI